MSARLNFRRWRRMCPGPQHAGGLPASGVTRLQAARSFIGDFLEFVSTAAIEYRSARGDKWLIQVARVDGHEGRSLLKPKTL
jgi:hypothetical protein